MTRMLPLFDPMWASLLGGYRVPFDPSKALSLLEQGQDAWKDLWQGLHHQGDVGEASYAAVPHLVRIAAQAELRTWNFYGLASTIEVERHRRSNPPLPDWLSNDYDAAWQQLQRLALRDLPSCDDALTVQTILGALALCKGQAKLGALISDLTDSELDELVNEKLAWDELYGG